MSSLRKHQSFKNSLLIWKRFMVFFLLQVDLDLILCLIKYICTTYGQGKVIGFVAA